MTEHLKDFSRGMLGVLPTATGLAISLGNFEILLRIISLLIGIAISTVVLVRLLRKR